MWSQQRTTAADAVRKPSQTAVATNRQAAKVAEEGGGDGGGGGGSNSRSESDSKRQDPHDKNRGGKRASRGSRSSAE